MHCSYHTGSAARVQCSSCARPLCRACDHRIKGYPYCQDCIVLGVEGLSRRYSEPRPRGRARWAALFALLPGMGAVYNHQNIKGVVHFATIVGLFQLTAINIVSGFFALAGLVFYLYSIIDAYRTAQLIAGGESAAADLMMKLGSQAEVARELAYRLYTLCERKKRAPEALAYNGLVQSWPEIQRLAREKGTPRAEQVGLFE